MSYCARKLSDVDYELKIYTLKKRERAKESERERLRENIRGLDLCKVNGSDYIPSFLRLCLHFLTFSAYSLKGFLIDRHERSC